jgi:hypothetical protein
MTTSTKELIAELMQAHKGHADEGASTFSEAAQRLRELDKPDCAWKNDDKRVDSYITGCNKRQNVRWSPYCFNCGGAVKGAT